MQFPEIPTSTPSPGPHLWHAIAGVGSIWSSVNIANFGASTWTLIPPFLIGVGSITTALVGLYNARAQNQINRDRLAFDRERYEHERLAHLAVAPVEVSAAATTAGGPP